MDSLKWDKLKKKCPRLYSHHIIFECSDGWFDLISDLSQKIESVLQNHKAVEGEPDCSMYAIQVKEKYGTLRFYMSCETPEITDLIHEAEALSSQTCEKCGDPGKMRENCFWYRVKCDKCYEEYNDRRK